MLRMDAGDAYGVMELGTNHPGEIRMLSRMLAPEWGVITNIGPAHIGFFGSLEAIAGEKAELLRALPADGMAFLNCDGAHFDLLRRAAPCRVVTVSAGGSADYVGERRDNGTRRVSVTESATGEKREFALPGPGAHHVVNVLFAVAVARQCGMPWEKVQDGIFGFRPLPLRGESINVAGVEVVNDAYNANPSSMRASIRDFIERPAVGVKWLVLGDMLELGEHGPAEHRDLGQFAGRGPWGGIILVGDLSRFAADGVLISGFPDDRVFRCSEASEAGRIMADNIARGDAALVKGSRGMRLEEAIAEFKRRREDNGQQNVDHQGFAQCAGCAGGTFVAGG